MYITFVNTIEFDHYIVQKHHRKNPRGRTGGAATVGGVLTLPLVSDRSMYRRHGLKFEVCRCEGPIG